MRLTFLLQVLSTLSLFGLIWFVQIVHYPLFLSVPEANLRAHAATHATRTTWVVAPLMLVELLSSCAIVARSLRPPFVSSREAWLGVALVAEIWVSTALVQVPLHNQLQDAPSAAVVRRLIATNWVRTLGWSLRTVLVLSWAHRLLSLALHS